MGTAILSDWLGSYEVIIQANRFLTTFFSNAVHHYFRSSDVTHSNAERLKRVSHKISVVPKTPLYYKSVFKGVWRMTSWLP